MTGPTLRRADIVLAAAGLVAASGLGVALWPRPTPTATVAPAAVNIQRPSAAVAGQPTALIIGDGYTSGSGLAETSYGCAAVTSMGWLCKAASETGTGYVSGGPDNRFALDDGSGDSTAFAERISRLAKTYDPDVVVLDGGRNDLFAEPGQRFDGIARTLFLTRQTWPQARIVVVAPRFLGKPDDDLGVDAEVIDQLREASGVKDLVVVDPIRRFEDTDTAPLLVRGDPDPEQAVPNREGERALAAALADALSREGIRPTT